MFIYNLPLYLISNFGCMAVLSIHTYKNICFKAKNSNLFAFLPERKGVPINHLKILEYDSTVPIVHEKIKHPYLFLIMNLAGWLVIRPFSNKMGIHAHTCK